MEHSSQLVIGALVMYIYTINLLAMTFSSKPRVNVCIEICILMITEEDHTNITLNLYVTKPAQSLFGVCQFFPVKAEHIM